MRAPLARLAALFGSLLLISAMTACAENAVAPNHDVVTPADTENITVLPRGEEEVALSAHLFGGGNEPVVILAHMRQNDQTAWYDYAEELVSHGYAALTFDFRGYGLSTGDRDEDTLDEDLSAVIQYMHDRGRDDIYLVGASMGATTSLVVAGANDVKAVVAVSPPAKFESQDALAAVPSLREPKLFMVSELDAPTLQFDELYSAAAEPKEEEVSSGNLHGTDLLDPLKNDQAAAARDRIIEFLDEQR